jgi:thioredoxin reductase
MSQLLVNNEHEHRVAIVGAGAAGLSAGQFGHKRGRQ